MQSCEKDLVQATQIAYLKCLEDGKKFLEHANYKELFSIKELTLAAMNKSISDIERIMNYCTADFISILYNSNLDDDDKKIISKLDEHILKWKIVNIHDTTNKNGFYNCVIETSKDSIIISFRGSEEADYYTGGIYDWVDSDFGLLNNADTIQTIETKKFAELVCRDNVVDKYKTIDVTGHSLGGNLASHFAVTCAQNIKTNKLVKKIRNVYNFDGPGVSNEYIDKYRKGIDKIAKKILHYKWSPVGNLLYNLPGEKEIFLKTKAYYGNSGIIKKIMYYTFGRHNTESLVFNECGMAMRGKEDNFSKALKAISLKFEQFPHITKIISSAVSFVIKNYIYKKQNGKIGFKVPYIFVEKDGYRCDEAMIYEEIVNEIMHAIENYMILTDNFENIC